MGGNNEIIFKMMQNVSDKLDDISSKINQKKDSKIENESILKISERIISHQQIIGNQIKNVKRDLEMKIDSTKPTINNNEKKEYILFGKDTPFTSKFLLVLIAVIMVLSYSFKYLPNYLHEKSEVKSERDSYKMFYEYVYLDAFSENNKIPYNLTNLITKIKKKDTVFVKHFNKLHKKYRKEMKKQELIDQLNQLK